MSVSLITIARVAHIVEKNSSKMEGILYTRYRRKVRRFRWHRTKRKFGLTERYSLLRQKKNDISQGGLGPRHIFFFSGGRGMLSPPEVLPDLSDW